MSLSKFYRQIIFSRHLATLYKEPDMLKTRLVARELYKKRVDDKKRETITNNARLVILGAECQGFSPSLILYSEGRGYMFNCGEGTQRFCYSNRASLVQLGNIFVTNVDWDRMSGLYGLALTMQDLGLTEFNINANESTENFLKVTSSFIMLHTGIKATNRPYTEGIYKDQAITVEPVPLDAIKSPVDVEHDYKRVKRSVNLIAYICELPDMQGALDPVRCRELNVPVGPLLGMLKSGKDVTLPDGKVVVRSVDVCGPKRRGLKLLVIECPSSSDIDRVWSNTTLSEIRSRRQSDIDKEIEIVVHFSSKNVLNDSRVPANGWMDFQKSVNIS
ncbi:uncharacterized protein LOC143868865 [Tasmannia lanceolata]|uniref:uncharacterized protein LOC143868865 n=1 Tax=Tasmannia lanceolata TaxID=3420 RepID=UPI0040637BA0